MFVAENKITMEEYHALRLKQCIDILKESVKLCNDEDIYTIKNLIDKYNIEIHKYNTKNLELINPTKQEVGQLVYYISLYFKINSNLFKRISYLMDKCYLNELLFVNSYLRLYIINEHYSKYLNNIISESILGTPEANAWILLGRNGREKNRLSKATSELLKTQLIQMVYDKNENFKF